LIWGEIEKKNQFYKSIKKIKRISIKIKITNTNNFFLLKGEIKKKNQFNKKQKKKIKLGKNTTYSKLRLKDEIQNK
jgi:hypothetical protein